MSCDVEATAVTFVSPASLPLLGRGGGGQKTGAEMRSQEDW